MSEGLVALDAIDALIAESADIANAIASTNPRFEDIAASAGVGMRLKALSDARAVVVRALLRDHESRADEDQAA